MQKTKTSAKQKENFSHSQKAAQKVYDKLREYLDADTSRGLVLDYFTWKLVQHNYCLIPIKPLVDLEVTKKKELSDLDTSEIDNLNWEHISPLALGWVYSHLMDKSLKEKNGAIYTPKEIVTFIVKTNVNWAVIADQTEDLKFLLLEGKGISSEVVIEDIKDVTIVQRLHDRLGHYTILDPCCGCGNFLYYALHTLAKMDDAAIAYLRSFGVERKRVTGLHQLHGMDIDPVACEICKRVLLIARWECQY